MERLNLNRGLVLAKTEASIFVTCSTWLRSSSCLLGGAVLLAIVAAGCNEAVAGNVDRQISTVNQDRGTLVVLGASYAKNWGVSELDGIAVLNRGVGGDETRGMLARFQQDVISVGPRGVLVWGFINDIFRAPRDQLEPVLAQTRSNIIAMLDAAKRAGIRPILATEVTVTNPVGVRETLARLVGEWRGKRGYHDFVNRHVRETNAWLRLLAAERRLPLLDFETVLADANGERRRQYAADDGSHLSSVAYEALTRYSRGKIGTALAR